MPIGIDSFKFGDVLLFADNTAAKADVVFTRDDEIGEGRKVSHVTKITVRVSLHAGATIEDMQKAVLDAAVLELRHALAMCDGKSAQDLVRETKAETKRRQLESDEKSERSLRAALDTPP